MQTLKPYIDSTYRTLTGPAHTFIAGSSMGGLISMYAILRYPNVFGGAGVFSPSFWLAPQVYNDAQKATLSGLARRFYIYAGGQESAVMVPDMDKMEAIIKGKGSFYVRRVMAPLGKHNEVAWRSEFPAFYQFILP